MPTQTPKTETEIKPILSNQRGEVLTKYELNDGPVSEATLRAIRKQVPQGDFQPTQSLFACA